MASTPSPGQIGVVQRPHGGIEAWAIRLFTRSRFSHAIVALPEGKVFEAQADGIEINDLTKYDGLDVIWSEFDLTSAEIDRMNVIAHNMRGIPYNYLDILAVGLADMGLRWKWLMARADKAKALICSQAADRLYFETGLRLYTDGRLMGQVVPEDLLERMARSRTVRRRWAA